MVASYEMIFTQPDSATYSKTGMLFGANLIVKSTDFLSRNPEIINLFQDYVQNCVLGPINACTLRITAAAGTELAGASSAGNVNEQRY